MGVAVFFWASGTHAGTLWSQGSLDRQRVMQDFVPCAATGTTLPLSVALRLSGCQASGMMKRSLKRRPSDASDGSGRSHSRARTKLLQLAKSSMSDYIHNI